MDWKSVRFDWNRARAFLVTAEEGTLSAAARALGMAQPTLGRQVDALEQELGLVLFERVGRGLRLTPAGLELLDHVRAMGEAAGRLSLTAYGQSQSIEGRVSISASDAYSVYLLPPIIQSLREKEPGIFVEIVASNATSDLRRREADIAIRNFRPTEPDLIARKLGDANARLYATRDYVESLGPVSTPHDLNSANFIEIDSTGAMIGVMNQNGFGLSEQNFPLRSENFLVMWALVRQGLGIGFLDDRIGDAEPGVVRVLPDLDPLQFPVWLVAHREVHRSRRLRFVFDHIAETLN